MSNMFVGEGYLKFSTLKSFKTGTSVANLLIAFDKETVIPVDLWNPETPLSSNLKTGVGKKVFVKGTLNKRQYTNKEGAQAEIVKVVADVVTFVKEKPNTKSESETTSENDLPF